MMQATKTDAGSPQPKKPTLASSSSSGFSLTALIHSTSSSVRHLVSKKKKRFIQDGFDLDLAYITPRLIAMGLPSTGAEAIYRNPASTVKEWLTRYHPGTCKVYNLCIEPDRQYASSIIGLPEELVETHGHYDHNPMPLFCVAPFCRSMAAWLAEDPNHVAAVHCKAGKGRTGMALCAYLVWSGQCASADEAVQFYGKMRTHNGKGVTIPSQHRYIQYTVDLYCKDAAGAAARQAGAAELDVLRLPPLLHIERVTLLNAPEWATAPGGYFTVEGVHRQDAPGAKGPAPRWRSWRVYDHRKPHGHGGGGSAGGGAGRAKSSSVIRRVSLVRGGSSADASAAASAAPYEGMACEAGHRPAVAGDVKVTVYAASGKKVCAAWFHTAFVADGALELRKQQLDKAKKNKELNADFTMRVAFEASGLHDESRAREGLLAASSQAAAGSGLEGEGEEADDDDDDDGGGELVRGEALAGSDRPRLAVAGAHSQKLSAI